MSKFIEKLGNSKIFMSIVMVYGIIFNIILMVICLMALPTNGSTSYSAFGFEMNVASHIVLAIFHILFMLVGIYLFIKLLKRFKDKTNLNLQNLVFSGKNNKWANFGIASVLFLWNIIYNFILFYITLSSAIANIVYSPQYGMQINFVIVSVYFIIALVVFIFALLNVLYYAFLIKKLLQKPKLEELNTEDINKEVSK